jgi:hypothetical protein
MKNWRTTLGSIMTAISLVPSGLAQLGITEMPEHFQKIGLVCAFISFIWTGLKTKDHNVTGGVQSFDSGLPKPRDPRP